MAATFNWCLDTGLETSGHGTTRNGFDTDTHYPTSIEWKPIDDLDTQALDAPIVIGDNSYTVYHYAKFTGTFNQIANCKWAHVTGNFGSNVILNGLVTSTYATPSNTANTDLTVNMTSPISISSGQVVHLSETGPEGTSSATLTTPGYSQYLATQILTTVGASPGSQSIGFTLSYEEN